ncbi:YjgF-like protein [Macrolepiota fuliginosa MF-IS2]|uniref:YjgF-like protein n=1 Tax=Macrolepiota fuliginosa MF-IS2 TaxID=1400762 RepID=A0A9P6C0I9_9AGAR|nr:YjgF-like protein [Macrolepiota fuliginosa MF-IS2]
MGVVGRIIRAGGQQSRNIGSITYFGHHFGTRTRTPSSSSLPQSLPSQLSQVRTMSAKATTHESLGIISTSQAPAAIGPYSQAIKVGSLLFCSGCIPLIPETMQVIEGGVEEQTRQALKNLKAVIEASGSELGKVVKTTVFLKDMNDFVAVNGIYANFFGDHKPARSAVEVARLPKDVLVEVEAIASLA